MRSGLALALCLALTVPAAGGEVPTGEVRITARLGLGGAVRARVLAPLVVDLDAVSASGAATLRGSVGEHRFAQPVELAAGARKRYELVVPGLARAHVEVRGPRGELLAAEEVRASTVPDDGVCTLLVARPEAQGSATDLEGLLVARGAAHDPGPIHVRHSTAHELPDHWAALAAADMVVVGDDDLERAPAGRLAALLHWTARGGTLVVSGGVRPARLLGTPLAGALPVELGGRTRTLETLAGLESAFPSAIVAPPGGAGLPAEAHPAIAVREPFVVPEATVRPDGRLLVAEPSATGPVPLLARRPLGDGAVWYLALDLEKSPLSYTGRVAEMRMWRTIAPRPVRVTGPPYPELVRHEWNLANGRVAADAAARALAIDPGGSSAGWLVAAFVALYWLAVAPAQYLLLKRKHALHAVWIVTPLLALAFSALAFGLGYMRRGGSTVARELAVVHGRAGDPVWAVEALARVHAFREAAYALAPGPGPSLAVPYRIEAGETPAWTRSGPVVGMGAMTVPMWADRLFWTATHGVPPVPAQARLVVAEDGTGAIAVTGALELGEPLRSACLVLGNHHAELGDVPRSATVDARMTERAPASRATWRAPGRRKRMDLGSLATGALAELVATKHPPLRLTLYGVRDGAPSGLAGSTDVPGASGSRSLAGEQEALDAGLRPAPSLAGARAGEPSGLAVSPPVSVQERGTLMAIALPYRLHGTLPAAIPPGYAHRRTEALPDVPLTGVAHSATARWQVRLFPFPRKQFEPRELDVVHRRHEKLFHAVKLRHRGRGTWDVVASPASAAVAPTWSWNDQLMRHAVMDPREYIQMPDGLIDVELESVPGGGAGQTRIDFEVRGVEGDPEAFP